MMNQRTNLPLCKAKLYLAEAYKSADKNDAPSAVWNNAYLFGLWSYREMYPFGLYEAAEEYLIKKMASFLMSELGYCPDKENGGWMKEGEIK